MKKYSLLFTTVLLSISIALCITSIISLNTSNEYTLNGYVVSVLEGERKLIETTDGNIWEIVDDDIWVGDTVILTLNDNGTPNMIDDKIIAATAD